MTSCPPAAAATVLPLQVAEAAAATDRDSRCATDGTARGGGRGGRARSAVLTKRGTRGAAGREGARRRALAPGTGMAARDYRYRRRCVSPKRLLCCRGVVVGDGVLLP